MENTYGIGIANRYELFYDQDDVTEFETVTTKKKEKKVKEPAQQQTTAPANGVQQKSAAEKENKAVKKENGPGQLKAPVDQQQRRGIKEQQNNSNKDNSTRKEGENKGFSSSNPRPAFNKTGGNAGGENREERNNRRNREMNGTTTDFEKQPRNPNRRNFDDGRKRQRDRQSGSDKTGVKSVDKRDGNGAHNWGSHKQDIDDINKPPTDDENKEAGEENVEDSPPAAPVEEEPKEMTLDEWKAQRQAQLVQPQYNLRKAGEGEDNAQWDKMKKLDKKTGDGETSRRDAEAAAAIKREADAKKKQVLEIDFHFNDGRRGGLGRRPNPGGRGTGGERGDRGDRGDRGGDRGDRGGDRGDRGGDRGDRGGDRADRGERRPPREGGADRADRGERRPPRPHRDNAGEREGGAEERPNQGEQRRPPRRPRFENNRRGDFNGRPEHVPHAPKVDDERDFPSLG